MFSWSEEIIGPLIQAVVGYNTVSYKEGDYISYSIHSNSSAECGQDMKLVHNDELKIWPQNPCIFNTKSLMKGDGRLLEHEFLFEWIRYAW